MLVLTQLSGFGAGSTNRDPYYSSVSALLHMNGADGATVFTDQKGNSWTANGNAQIDTAQSQFGGASGLFDGTGDYLSIATFSGVQFGTGDFTVEMWVRFNATGDQCLIGGASNGDMSIRRVGDNTLRVGQYSVVWDNTSGAETWTNGTWYHVAIARSGSTLKMFKDGVEIHSGANSVNYTIATTAYIGTDPGPNPFNGWLDDVRITKGTARYTAGFTPPTSAYPDK